MNSIKLKVAAAAVGLAAMISVATTLPAAASTEVTNRDVQSAQITTMADTPVMMQILSAQAQAPAASPGRANVADGISCSGGCHFWFTASYNDFARGIAYGVIYGACVALIHVPWICGVAATWAQSVARGWGGGSNHGIWGSVYANGHYQGGRW